MGEGRLGEADDRLLVTTAGRAQWFAARLRTLGAYYPKVEEELVPSPSCAACGKSLTGGGNADDPGAGLDGRPSDDSLRALPLEECPHCGDRGVSTLRAAWANEAAGRTEIAQRLRLESAELLEAALFQGFALEPVRGASSVLLAELFRVGGDPEKAAQHCHWGLRSNCGDRERGFLFAEVIAIVNDDTRPLTRASAWELYQRYAPKELVEACVRLIARFSSLVELSLRLRPGRARDLDEILRQRATVFAEDFLQAPEILLDLLRAERPGVWQGLVTREKLALTFLGFIEHDEAVVRKHTLVTLREALATAGTLPGQSAGQALTLLLENLRAVAAIARRRKDDDPTVAALADEVFRKIAPALALGLKASESAPRKVRY